MTLLTAVQDACQLIGIGVPAAVMTATDDLTVQLRALAQDSLTDITKRHGWQGLRVERTFATVASQAQPGSLPADYDRMAPGITIWNRSTSLPLVGPVAPEQWAMDKAWNTAGAPNLKYRLMGGQFQIWPVPAAGQVIGYEYVSNLAVVAADATLRRRFLLDTDTPRFPEQLLMRNIVWRWKAVKGLDYAEELAAFERLYELKAGADRGEVMISTASHFHDEMSDTLWPGTIG